MPADYFNEGDNFYNRKEFVSAKYCFGYIVKNFPGSEEFPRAVSRLGKCHMMLEEHDSAMVVFKSTLNDNFKSSEPKRSIDSDEFRYTQHYACCNLSEIYSKKEQYDSSLFYLDLAKNKFYVHSFCGNANLGNATRIAVQYSILHEKMGNKKLAISTLLAYVMEDLYDNDDVNERLGELLRGQKKLKKELNYGLRKMEFKQGEDGFEYSFKFMDTTLTYISKIYYRNAEGPRYLIGTDKTLQPEMIRYLKKHAVIEIKNSSFYKMIEALSVL